MLAISDQERWFDKRHRYRIRSAAAALGKSAPNPVLSLVTQVETLTFRPESPMPLDPPLLERLRARRRPCIPS